MASYYRDHVSPQDIGQPMYVNQPPAQYGPPAQNTERPSLRRTISTSNLEQTEYCQVVVRGDIVVDAPQGGTNFLASTPAYTLTIPSLDNIVPGFKQFVIDKLVDKITQASLERENVLNWCHDATKLVPFNTVSDGNCLLHAASLGMWGFQDKNLVLRRALADALRYNNGNTLYQRWEYYRYLENQKLQIELEPQQWKEEWESVLRQTSPEAEAGRNLDSLDEFHVFVLANVLRRPILMYASPKHRSLQGEGTLQEVNFHGVYLPLLWENTICKKNPLALAYNGGHFSALVAVDSRFVGGLFILPLVDYQGKELPVKFALAVEEPVSLFMDYLDLTQIPFQRTSTTMLCAKLTTVKAPDHFSLLVSGFIEACSSAFGIEVRREDMRAVDARVGGGESNPSSAEEAERIKCINACGMYGDAKHAYLCSNCYRKTRVENQTDQQSPLRHSPRDQYNRENQLGAEGRELQGNGGTSLGTVKCPQCSEPGYAQLLGMCKRCYDNNTSLQGRQDPIYESLPGEAGQPGDRQQTGEEPPAIPPPRNPKERCLCRNPRCNYYGSEENRFYCSQCFNNNMEAILKEVDGPLPVSPSNPGIAFPIPVERPKVEQPPPVGGDADPPLCYSCNHFFSSEEYAGLCNSCFMKSTVSGGPRPRRNTEPGDPTAPQAGRPAPFPSARPEERLPHGYHNPTAPQAAHSSRQPPFPSTRPEERLPHGYHNPTAPQAAHPNRQPPFPPARPEEQLPHDYYNLTAPQAAHPNRAPFQSDEPLPHQRVPNSTAPVANLTSQMADMSMSPDCIMCNGGRRIGESPFYSICKKHAEATLGGSRDDRGSDGRGETRSKPPPLALDHDAYQHSSVNPGYQRQGQGPETRPPHHEGGGVDQVYEKRGVRQQYVNEPQFGSEQSRYDPRQRGTGQGYPPDMQPRQPRNEQGYPPQQQPRQPRNEQGYPPQQQDMQPRQPRNEQGYPPQEPDREIGAHRFGNEQGYPRREPHIFGNEQDYPPQEFGNERGHVQHGPQQHHPPAGAMGGGAAGGATGGEAMERAPPVDGSNPPIMKSLCANVGCSFKGYKDLDGLCPDCYRDAHQNADISEEKYPLV